MYSFPHYLKNFYVESVAFRSDILRFVMMLMPAGHIFMGTDYPFDMADPDPVSSITNATKDDKASAGPLLGGNLARLLKIYENKDH